MSNKNQCPHCGKMLVKLKEHIRTIHPQTPEDIEYRDKQNKRRRNYAQINRDIINKCNADWRERNPEKNKQARKTWADNNKEKVKQYRIIHKDHIKLMTKLNRSQKINCKDCGVEICKGYLSQHRKFCCKNHENGQKKNKAKTDRQIRNDSINIIKGKKPPISELDKLRAQIRRAEQQKEIKRNLTIMNDVILIF